MTTYNTNIYNLEKPFLFMKNKFDLELFKIKFAYQEAIIKHQQSTLNKLYFLFSPLFPKIPYDYDILIKKERYYIKKYSLSAENLYKMFTTQNGLCAICKCTLCGCKVVVDHNHQTHKVRALVCEPCNILLGQKEYISNKPIKIKEYLNKYN